MESSAGLKAFDPTIVGSSSVLIYFKQIIAAKARLALEKKHDYADRQWEDFAQIF